MNNELSSEQVVRASLMFNSIFSSTGEDLLSKSAKSGIEKAMKSSSKEIFGIVNKNGGKVENLTTHEISSLSYSACFSTSENFNCFLAAILSAYQSLKLENPGEFEMSLLKSSGPTEVAKIIVENDLAKQLMLIYTAVFVRAVLKKPSKSENISKNENLSGRISNLLVKLKDGDNS